MTFLSLHRVYLPLKARLGARGAMVGQIAFVAVLHLGALAAILMTEAGRFRIAVAVLCWGLLNGLWLTLLRRPAASATLSLIMILILMILSNFKHQVLYQTANFVDLMVIDTDTIQFLFAIFPGLAKTVAVVGTAGLLFLALAWRLDPFRVPRLLAFAGAVVSAGGIVLAAHLRPMDDTDTFYGTNHISGFARSGVSAIAAYLASGFLESDASAGPPLAPPAACNPTQKLPHIILVHDESNFDARAIPGVVVRADYGAHFLSFDGGARKLVMEATGGPSWYAEYNVLSGLSARSYGRFAYFVTRIAARHVTRGLPNALVHCGYRTFSSYPFYGAFMSARRYQTEVGIQHFADARDLHIDSLVPDHVHYDHAIRTFESEHTGGPMFVFVYLGANHFPWDVRYHPELLPEWRNLGNPPEVDEYLRRQEMGFREYATFLTQLREKFPNEAFLIVRYGDHQPDLTARLMEPGLPEKETARHIAAFDPRYYASYYALDAINFTPRNLASALPTLDSPYLPLVTLEAAGVPLDSSFVEQKNILERCKGVFYECGNGAEARRFNRLLIDAGEINGL